MHDMTRGAVRGHVLRMSGFMLATMVVQTLYSLVDLYWVGRLGAAAVAAVSLAANLQFLVIGITQVLAVGTVARVAQAAGRGDPAEVQRLFNCAQGLSLCAALGFLLLGFALREPYVAALTGDASTRAQALAFLDWFVPAMALQFTMVGVTSALRGIGSMKPGMIASIGSILLNVALAPVLIFGWGTGVPLGVAGAALSTFVATLAAVLGLALYLLHGASVLRLRPRDWRPVAEWARILAIGLPAGAEFLLMGLFLGMIYVFLAPFGADAQAGFGIGLRLMQAFFMPAVALAFAVAAVAGQNYGAQLPARVRQTFRDSAGMAIGLMLLVTALCHVAPARMIGWFSAEPAVIVTGAEYLRIVSYNFVASGLIMVAGGILQGIGHTWPSLIASASRLVLWLLPVAWLSQRPGFAPFQIWVASVISVTLQMLFMLLLLRRAFRLRLGPPTAPAAAAVAA